MLDPDAALLQALRTGDEASFELLVRRYHTRMLRVASSFVPSNAIAEEVVQDTWLAVVRGADRFEGRSSVRTWLFRILVNRARTAGTREPRQASIDDERTRFEERFDPSGRWSSPPVPWAEAVDDRMLAVQLAARVHDSLDELPDAQRQVLVLRDIEGMDAAAVCDVLGISAGNQRVLLHRARARVRGMLERELGRAE